MRRLLNREYRFKKLESLEELIYSLSFSGKVVFFSLAGLFIGSALFMLWQLNNSFLVAVPRKGGTLTEGVIGLPRFINPILSVTDGDKDLSALIYSGLMRHNAQGVLVPDLAESYSISPDGQKYSFTLRADAVFQDGTPVTADDVEFTIMKIQDPEVKSIEAADWQGITIEKTDSRNISFILKQAYAPFIENTAVGILPKHLWKDVTNETFSFSELNSNPVGSGPFEISSIKKASNGVPTQYILKPFTKYVGDVPLISRLAISFYTSEKDLIDAYNSGDIDSMNSISPDAASKISDNGGTIIEGALPRVFGVFFNQSENAALSEVNVREALNISVNRQFIVNTVLQGYGTPLTEPVPQAFVGGEVSTTTATSTQYEAMVEKANTLLDKNGWKLNSSGIREKKYKTGTSTLAFSISTSDAPELKEIADILKEEWQRIGVQVTVKVFEGGYLNQNVIRPRHYDALLFGQVINRDLDLYAFWNSSEKNDPGLNVALYSNSKVDSLLKDIRSTSDPVARAADYKKFQEEISADVPAVFLYSPHFIYVVPSEVKNQSLSILATPSERFAGISNWYINVDKVWRIFIRFIQKQQ